MLQIICLSYKVKTIITHCIIVIELCQVIDKLSCCCYNPLYKLIGENNMAHYDQFQVSPCMVPMGNTSDLINKETNTIDDALGFCNGMPANECQNPVINDLTYHNLDCIDKPRKHIKGKAEGARYCYLSSIAAASEYAETAADYLARRLDELLGYYPEVSEQINLMMVVEYATIAIGNSKQLWDGVVAVRRKALESGKYTQESWKESIDPDLLLDAAARHMISYLYIDEIDEESGENHLCHVVANVLMFAYQLRILRDGEII